MVKHSIRGIQLTLGLAALCFTSAVANAQVDVLKVRLTVSGPTDITPFTSTAVYCSTSDGCAATGGQELWNLGAGVHLNGGETLVLTQTGLIPGLPGGNFDTSDRVKDNANVAATSPYEADCRVAFPCTVTIAINGIVVYGPNGAGMALNAFNQDTNSPEGSPYAQIYAQANYSLSVGYADNEHGASFFPTPFTGATRFIGAGNGALGTCLTTNCYDAGVLMITGVQVPVLSGCTLTQGGYKNHFNSKVLNLPAPNLKLGNVPYTNSQINDILQNNAIKGNGLLSLAHQLATAKLNIRYGASAPAGVLAAIAAADALIGNLVVPPVGPGFLSTSLTSALEGTLDDFNNGVTGPGHCG